MTVALELRLTHTYVGTYQHLDKWEEIGSVDEIGSRDISRPYKDDDEYDPCEHRAREVFCLVKVGPELWERWLSLPGATELNYDRWAETQIKRALCDIYSSHDCAHEYDCCGCWSHYADAERHTGDLWRVVISSSRNY